jgi:hypothetical protein
MFELDELELFPKSSRTVRFANCSTHLYWLAGQRVAKAKPQNHNKRLPLHQATQAGKSAAKPAGQKAARASNSAVGQAGLQNQNKRFWVPIDIKFFWARKLRFLKNTFNTTTQRRISRRAFWLIQKKFQFFRSGVNRKKALTPSLIELETSK